MQQLFMVVTVVVVGLMVGVELSVAAFVNPGLGRLPDAACVAGRSDSARVLGRVMPFWYILSVVLVGWWAVQSWGRAQALLVTVVAALLVVSVVLSVALLEPINARVARWTAQSVPADWQQQVGKWDGLHYVRVGILVATFILLVVAGTA
ncbi:anthrone oxygenase family protein [Deinococcus sp.]|uniref:anthrone oxygenase family protein n=1 Tax=Deinococcus sp. TaxID=47478 RepID=UPI003B59C5DE